LRIVFKQLVKRKYLKKNPFRTEKISNKPVHGLLHEVLPFSEAKIVINHLYQFDRPLFYFVVISFFGLARPKEICRRLKRCHLHLDRTLIEIIGVPKTKTKKTKWLTIPTEFKSFFEEAWFQDIPDHYFIFGKSLVPGLVPSTRDHITKRYSQFIKQMFADDLISQEYTELYDWKRRGITKYLSKLPAAVVSNQAAHTKITTTMIYHHPEPFSQEISDSRTGLIID
jgi:hypothetical protein